MPRRPLIDAALPVLVGSRVVDEATAALRGAILSGDLSPEEKLSVLSLCLGVSRSPVREGVLALSAEGLAVESPRRSVVVAEVEQLVEPGDIHPDDVHLPGIYVQRVVELTSEQADDKRIEKRTTRETEGD